MKKSKPLIHLKQKLSSLLNTGVTRIKLTDSALLKVYASNKIPLNQLARTLINQKLLKIIPQKRRPYKIIYGKKKVNSTDKLKKTTSLNYLLKRKIISKKDIWVKKIRQFRKILKDNKSNLSSKYYRLLRQQVKGNYIKKPAELNLAIKKYEKSE